MDERSAKIVSITQVGEETVAIELETPDGMVAKPGQFFLIRATVEGEEFARHYTMSSPDAEETFELTVGIDPEGDFSPWLASREPGDLLSITGPFGRIFYDGEPDSAILAGGPGIGAGLGVAERAHRDGGQTTLIARCEPDDLPHERRLATLASSDVPVFICRDERSIASAVSAVMAERPDTQWFVFGFRPFASLARDAIVDAGGVGDDAKIESYG